MTTTSHALKFNGAAYTNTAALVNADTKVTSGPGRALCTCGILSEELPTGSARRAWFKAHKLAALDTEVAAEKAETELLFSNDVDLTETVQGQDVQAGTPADEVAEALAELVEPAPVDKPKRAPKKPAETPGVDDAASEPNAATANLAFSKSGAVPGFWRSLGREAVKTVVEDLFPTVTVTPNNNAQALHFQGPKDDVTAAVAAVKEMWGEALLAVKEWKTTDPDFLGRATEPKARRQEGYHLTEAFYAGFGATYLEWRKSH